MLPALREFFSSGAFMPHGHCYLWKPELLWLQVISNLAIGLAYVAIALTLAYLVQKGDYLPFRGTAVAFGTFIVSCGITHFFDVYVIWRPAYWLDGTMRAITAVASVSTALFLPRLVPKAIELARGAKAMQERGVALATALDDLGRLYERTKEVERLKTELFANVSHELRTPLTLMLGPAERLLGGGGLSPAQRRDLELIVHNGRVLLEHVNDLLDAARLEAGRLAPTYARVELDRLVQRVSACFEGLATERGIAYAVEVPSPLPAEVDPDELGRVLLNLLSNAFKHAPSGGAVRCTVSTVGGPDGERVRIEVSDSGPGIAPEHRARVFERFVQGEGVHRAGGTGLGLAIAKDFVELHGGTIEVSEAPEGGACFVVELPRLAPPGTPLVPAVEPAPLRSREGSAGEGQGTSEAAPASPWVVRSADRGNSAPVEPAAEALAAPRVLVVEDDAEMNRFVCESLAPELRAEPAFDGREGLAKAIALRPDLVISDVMMPRASGEELVLELRQRPELDAVPVLLLTARADEAQRVRLLASGAQDWLAKPFSPAELRVRAGNLVAMKRARDVLQEALGHRGRDLEALASELTQRRAELRVALAQAEESSRLKTDFLRMVSHELRSPLATLQLQLDRLQATLVDADGPGSRLVRRMLGSTGRLRELIDGLLRYSRVHGGQLEPKREPIDVPALCRAVADELREQARAKELALRVDAAPGLPPLRSDVELVRLVLVNLVGNAIKFTATGGVTLVVEHDGVAHHIAVRDSGPGIPEGARERVFAPFEQLEAVSHKHAVGVGLGLALVRETTRALGGTVTLTSELGVGSTFTVVLPDVAERAPAPAQDAGASELGAGVGRRP